MRTFFTILFFMFVSMNAFAVEPIDEQQVMLYYEVPLGASSPQQSQHQFGLRLDRTSHDPYEAVQISDLSKRTAALDFRMGYEGMQSLKIYGKDYASYLVARAAEGEEAPVKPAAETPAESAPAEAASPPAEGKATTEPAAAAEKTTTAEAPGEEKGPIAKKIGELPFGMFIGVAVGLVILTGAGG